jgi:hypothetical protein
MKLPLAPPAYRQHVEVERNRALELADGRNHKRGQDMEIAPGRLILTAPNGTRYALTVDNLGALGTTAL